jgi:hypothetical protein
MLFIPRGGLRMQGVRYGGAEHEVDDWKGGLVETVEGGGVCQQGTAPKPTEVGDGSDKP